MPHRAPAWGGLASDGDEPVGWAAVAPRSGTSFTRNRKIPHVDDLPVWSLWCIRVRPGHRRKGISHALIAHAADTASVPAATPASCCGSTCADGPGLRCGKAAGAAG